jgi:hypothetical protein
MRFLLIAIGPTKGRNCTFRCGAGGRCKTDAPYYPLISDLVPLPRKEYAKGRGEEFSALTHTKKVNIEPRASILHQNCNKFALKQFLWRKAFYGLARESF